ncbi:MAG: hypothetical protein ACQESH_05315 [Campylobacterota bacterium]
MILTACAILFSGCLYPNDTGISHRYYKDCYEYYDLSGRYHKECDENLVDYKSIKKLNPFTNEQKQQPDPCEGLDCQGW